MASEPEPAASTASWSRGRALLVVLAILLVTAAATFVARGLKLDQNLEVLLDERAPAVVALDELRARQGSTDLLYVAVKSDDFEANRRMTAEIARRLRTWPEVIDVVDEYDYTVLRDRALYYLSESELRELDEAMQREHRKAVAKSMRLGIGEGDQVDAEDVGDDWDADLEEIEDAPAKPAEKVPEREVSEVLDEVRERLRKDDRVADLIDAIWPEEKDGRVLWPERVTKPIASPDGKTHVVQARMRGSATDVAYARGIADRIDALIVEMDLPSYAPGAMGKLGGAWLASKEASAIERDLSRATGISAALVVAVLLVGFRSLRILLIVFLPIVVSSILTLAAARVLFGKLNVLTAFLIAVLIGIGVDFAIHLYAVRETQGPRSDWAGVIRRHVRPLASSMATTVGSFLILMTADFRGFREFGLIAAIGVLISFLISLVLVPALDLAMGPLRRRVHTAAVTAPAQRPWTIVRWTTIAICVALGAAGATGVGFEKDLRELRAPESTSEQKIAYTSALGKHTSGTPVVMMTDDPAVLEQAVDRLHGEDDVHIVPAGVDHKLSGMSWVQKVVALSPYLPKDQPTKQAILAEIARRADTFVAEIGEPKDEDGRRHRDYLETLLKLSRAPPIGVADVPSWASLPFRELDGTVDRIGLLYTRLETFDMEQVQFVARRFREVMEGLEVRGASSRFVLADLSTAVERDAARLPPYALLVILVLIALDLRGVRSTLVCFTALCLGLLLTFGLMGLIPIRINFYNLVVMPSVIGMGIDASIHLWYARGLGSSWATSKGAALAALTTAAGFSGLLVAEHKGLRSIGLLGVVATLGCVAAALGVLGGPGRAPKEH